LFLMRSRFYSSGAIVTIINNLGFNAGVEKDDRLFFWVVVEKDKPLSTPCPGEKSDPLTAV